MKPLDMGEIIGRYAYVRKIYSSELADGSSLIIHPTLFSKISPLNYTSKYFGINIRLSVNLPDSKKEKYRYKWLATNVKRLSESAIILEVDKIAGLQIKDVVLAKSSLMSDFGTSDGDRIVLKANIPIV